MLTAFCSQDREDWDLWLDSVVYAYNTSRHESLGVSTYEVVFGRLPRIPLELELGLPLVNPMTQSEYVSDTRKALQDIREVDNISLHELYFVDYKFGRYWTVNVEVKDSSSKSQKSEI